MHRPTPEPSGAGARKPPGSASLWGGLIFRGKAFALRRLRTIGDFKDARPRRHRIDHGLAGLPVSATIRARLWTDTPGGPHDRALTAGKIHNLRCAVRSIDGVEVPAGELFSFWAQVGRPSRLRGFVPGRELREGCMTASIGGGLCQLSNALYAAALEAGFEIVERHPHSAIVPGSEAEAGRDATVFWNYLDLRLRAAAPFRIEAHLSGHELVVVLRGGVPIAAAPKAVFTPSLRASDCVSCGQSDCRNHTPDPTAASDAPTAWLIEAPHAEFGAYFASHAGSDDHLFLPTRLGPRGTRWPASRCPESTADVEAMRRRLAVRRAPSGAALQYLLIESAARTARSFARRLSHLHTDLVISQSLLPHLWRDNVLQGRHYDVLLDRLPYDRLHEALDAALAAHPDSSTLGEFRAPAALVEAERAGLASARRLITAHLTLAGMQPHRTLLTDWQSPPPMKARGGGKALLMPASALARKGAYALREALKGLDTELIVSRQATERAGFWQDLPVRILSKDEPMPALAGVVLPALIDHRPEPLLAALAAELPVVATDACGLAARPGLTLVGRDDDAALHGALASLLQRSPSDFLQGPVGNA